MSATRRRAWLGFAVLLGACDMGDASPPARDAGGDVTVTLKREDLLKPEICAGCHPQQYREWSTSMHAYAAQDPVFLAMNQRGQRETNNELGDFCVRCHAPMAVIENKTTDGLNLADVPAELKGVTCYFCHNAVGIEESHNGALKLANDTTMRGSFCDPTPTLAHDSACASIYNRKSTDSAALCGACHDVVTPKGVHIERTFEEYGKTLFPQPTIRFQTCQGCHMDERGIGKAAQVSQPLPDRQTYEHLWAGVDVALEAFPYRDAQRVAIQCELSSSGRVSALSLLSPLGEFKLELETDAGHAQPSGAAHDRRTWVEFVAYDESDTIVYQSGMIADDQPEKPAEPSTDPRIDPTPWSFGDHLFDVSGREVHFFWEAEKSDSHPEGYTSSLLKPLAAADVPHTVTRTFRVPSGIPARVTVRVRIRPIGRDILDELVRSGDLDPKYIAEMPTFTLDGTVVEWKQTDGYKLITAAKPRSVRCPDDYRCLLYPERAECAPKK